MSTSEFAQVADAVTAALNGAALSQTFTAARRMMVPTHDSSDLAALTVSVVPATRAEAIETRTSTYRTVSAYVAIQQRLQSPADDAEVDALVILAEEIAALFRLGAMPLAGGARAQWQETQIDPVYDQDHLRQQRTFTSVLLFSFRVVGEY
jgi:hypothetical protein